MSNHFFNVTIIMTLILSLAGIPAPCANAEEPFANDIDTTYKFSAIKAPESPYKNTWSSFQTDLFSGSFGYAYEIEAPPGTNGLTPDISLSYTSHAARGKAGWVGSGWELPLNYVQRDIEYTRKDISDDTFDLNLSGAKHDLVFVSADNRFHTKIESYLKIEKQTGAPNETGEYWLVTARDGTRFRFGYTADAEHMVNATDATVPNFVWRWSLDRIEDTNGNCIFFSYTETPGNGEAYLSKIEYNSEKKRVIEFILEERDDDYLFIDQGSEVTETKRLTEIRISVNGELAKRYEFAYQLNDAQNKSLLTSVTQFGEDGVSALPLVRFEYKPLIQGFGEKTEWNTPSGRQWIRRVDHKSNTIVDTFDVNGDSRPDLVKAKTDDDDNDYWEVYLNTGTGFSRTPETAWELPSGWNDIRDVRRSRSLDDGANTRSAPMDINRDGLLDIARANSSSELEYELNTGTEFKGKSHIELPIDDAWIRRVQSPSDNDRAPNVKQTFTDINGDGYPDLVQRENEYYGELLHAWHIWRFDGEKFTDFGHWAVINEWIEDFERDDGDVEAMLSDMNGDGLPDIIWGRDGDLWEVYINTGSDFMLIGNWAPAELGDDDIIEIDDPEDDTKANNTRRVLADINGDGLPDVVQASDENDGKWNVYLNKGSGFTGKIEWQTPFSDESVLDMTYDDEDDPEEREARARRDMLDINGDGSPDIVHSTEDGYWEVWLSNAVQADMLKKITDTLGGTIAVEYASSLNVENSRFPERRLNSNYWLVTSLTTHNGMSGAHANISQTRFSYADGWYHFEDREFRGFARVEETRADGTKVIHYFHQDEASKGKEYQTETRRGSDAALFALSKNQWQNADSGSEVLIPRLLQTDEYTYDGIPENPKNIRTEFQDHDDYGNVKLEIRHGDVAVTGDDETFHYKEFSYDTERWIVDKISRSYVTATAGGEKLRENWFEYDENGNLEKEQAWLDTSSENPFSLYEYDECGNRISSTDPEGHTSRAEYDSEYCTFPIKSYDAKNHLTIRSFNPQNGQVLSETDPNGFVTSYEYDVFGRKIKEIRPGDSSAQPTTRIEYFIDGTAPEWVKTSKREVSGTDETLDTYQFIDGFANLIQSKTEYEDPAYQIVSDVFYDEMGRVRKQSAPYLAGNSSGYTSPAGAYASVYSYDTLGRPVLITNPDGTQIYRIFDHWTVTESDEKGRPQTYHFNSFQKPTQVVENNGDESYITRYQYDSLGQIVRLTDHPGNETTIRYDALGRKISMSDPDMGTWTYGYDRAGNLTEQTDARSITTKISYDELNRKTRIDYPKDTDIEFFYDEDTIGTLSRVADASGTVRYHYDERLRKIRETQTIDSETWITEWGYDALDRVISQVYPDGHEAFFLYNTQGKLAGIPGVVENISYNQSGQMTEKTYANGLTTTYDYNPSNQRLTAMKCPGLQDFGYAYDEVGNILSVADGIAGQTDTFTYDDLDRLKSAGDGGYRASYEYDAVGNMTSETMLADMFDTGRKRGGPVKIHHKADYFYGDNAGPHAVTRKVITQFGNSDTSETPGQSGNTKRYFSASFHSAFPANFAIYDSNNLECGNEACDIPGADFELNSDGTRIVSLPISEDGGNSYRFVMSSSKDGTGTLTVRAYEGDVEISSDTQEFEIKANQLFKTSVSASLPSSEQPVRFETPAPCESPHDFDCNEKVDDADIAKVTSKWNLSCGVPGYDPIYDLDGDCYISILDIMAVVSNSTR